MSSPEAKIHVRRGEYRDCVFGEDTGSYLKLTVVQ